MIFGHLLTSSNYDDEEEKVTGGRNGYGAKLCNIFSHRFTVETASKEYKKCLKQVSMIKYDNYNVIIIFINCLSATHLCYFPVQTCQGALLCLSYSPSKNVKRCDRSCFILGFCTF